MRVRRNVANPSVCKRTPSSTQARLLGTQARSQIHKRMNLNWPRRPREPSYDRQGSCERWRLGMQQCGQTGGAEGKTDRPQGLPAIWMQSGQRRAREGGKPKAEQKAEGTRCRATGRKRSGRQSGSRNERQPQGGQEGGARVGTSGNPWEQQRANRHCGRVGGAVFGKKIGRRIESGARAATRTEYGARLGPRQVEGGHVKPRVESGAQGGASDRRRGTPSRHWIGREEGGGQVESCALSESEAVEQSEGRSRARGSSMRQWRRTIA